MNKKSFLRLLSLFLVILMAVALFSGCANSGEGDGDGSNDEFDAITNDPENPNIPKTDYNGYTFSIICQPYLNSNAYSYDWMVSDGENSTVLMDAVYRRNGILEDKYNIKFEQQKVTGLTNVVRTQSMGGVVEFDMIISTCLALSALARENLLLDLRSVERFDMTKSYWDPNAAEQLTIGGKLYFTNCAFNVQEVAFVTYFNKQLIEDYKLTSPYEYMANNEWTIDNWAKLATSISVDMNSDGNMTATDRYGTLVEYHNPRMFLFASGVRATTMDETGYPKLTLFDTDKPVRVYEKCKEVFTSAAAWWIDDMPMNETYGYPDVWDYARSLFCQDLYLFHYEGTNIIHQFADMESEFGIVPIPKYDKNQESYLSMYPLNCAMMALPSAQADLERTANIVEDLNFYSKVVLRPAWYDTLLARRYVRDDESEKSLDLILAGRVYDVGVYYDFGGFLLSKVLDIDVRTNNISTNFNKYKKAIEIDIKKMHGNFLINK